MKDTVWSFSRIDHSCLAAWFQHYVLKKPQDDSPWNVAGSELHEIMEAHSKQEISAAEAKERFENIWWKFQPRFGSFMGYDLNKTYYRKIEKFFNREVLLIGDTIETERRVNFTLPSGAKMTGLIDREANNNGYEIQDYKIANPSSPAWSTDKKKRQLYLYCEGIKQLTGKYPDRMRFIFFQFPKKDIVIEFNEKELEETIEWAEGRIKNLIGRLTATQKLGAKGLFLPDYKNLIEEKTGERNMFCKQICGYRDNGCPFVDGNHLKMMKPPKNQEFKIHG